MLICAIDTSGKNGSIGVLRYISADGGLDISGHVEKLSSGAYSAEVIPKLTALLARGHHNKSDIDAFVVASGPGSFTGLRVGLSTVKALADALHKPIATVSVLEAVAVQTAANGHLLVAIDAGRKQVYVGEFQVEGRNYRSSSERLVDLDEFARDLKASPLTVFTPDENVAEALRPVGRTVMLVRAPLADTYAAIGAERILAGDTISPAELDANYIRRSDAEIFFKGAR